MMLCSSREARSEQRARGREGRCGAPRTKARGGGAMTWRRPWRRELERDEHDEARGRMHGACDADGAGGPEQQRKRGWVVGGGGGSSGSGGRGCVAGAACRRGWWSRWQRARARPARVAAHSERGGGKACAVPRACGRVALPSARRGRCCCLCCSAPSLGRGYAALRLRSQRATAAQRSDRAKEAAAASATAPNPASAQRCSCSTGLAAARLLGSSRAARRDVRAAPRTRRASAAARRRHISCCASRRAAAHRGSAQRQSGAPPPQRATLGHVNPAAASACSARGSSAASAEPLQQMRRCSKTALRCCLPISTQQMQYTAAARQRPRAAVAQQGAATRCAPCCAARLRRCPVGAAPRPLRLHPQPRAARPADLEVRGAPSSRLEAAFSVLILILTLRRLCTCT